MQGVGAKVALAVLGTLSAAELANAMALQDKAPVARAPGVGPKVAARIVAELKDKAPALSPRDQAVVRLAAGRRVREPQPARDAVSALINLGYAHGEAAPPCRKRSARPAAKRRAEALIRLGLKELAQ